MPFKPILLLCVFLLTSVQAIPLSMAENGIEETRVEESWGDEEVLKEDDEAILNVLRIMEEETKYAKDAKTYTDFVPGMVTVLRGDELEMKGVHTVYEALALVPGLHLSITSSGEKKIIVRGVGMTYASGSLKLLLNNVSLNDTLSSTSSVLYDIPIEQVDRIDVIRGPGAVRFGEYAYAGVINVITRKNGNRVFGRYGSFDTYAGGGLLSYAIPEKDLSVSLNLAGWDTGGGDVDSGLDRLYGTGSPSHSPGPTNEVHQDSTAVLALDFKTFSLLGQFASIKLGDYFGFGFTLPGPDDRKVQTHENWVLEARQKLDITPSLKGELKLGWWQFVRDWTAEVSPDSLTEDTYYKERRLYGALDLTWKEWEGHTLLFGLAFSGIDVLDAWQEANGADQGWIVDDETREISSIFVEDEFEITDRLTITGGLRYDYYNDVGDSTTPRVAGVYRLKDHHILKAQYAEAFRPPTFLEICGLGQQFIGNPGIDPETIRTYEVGYIYKHAHTDGRITLFYSELEDLIVEKIADPRTGIGRYENIGNAELMGIELELERQVARNFDLNASLSYVTTEDKDTGEEIVGSANWIGNSGVIFRPWKDFSTTVQYRYVGKQHRSVTDTRDKLDDYDTVDITLNAFNLFRDGLTLRCGVKNLFDEDVVFPAPEQTYPDDYPRPDRVWWVQFSYDL